MKRATRIAVVGCINSDTVKRPGKPTIRGLGGILYNVFGLSRLLGGKAEILPVCNLGRNVSRQVLELLTPLKNVSRAHIKIVSTNNNHCTMTYREHGERDEVFTGFVPSISFSQLEKTLTCDIVLVNFISGHDVMLNAFKRFRDTYRGQIYFDFHTLSLGLRRNGTRFIRKPKRWIEYITCCDYLQLNRREFRLLACCPPDERSLQLFFEHRVQPTSSALLVTLDRDGAAMVLQRRGKTDIKHEQPIRRRKVIDTTGAGDLFSSGFCAGLAMGRSLDDCLKIAVKMGGYGCSITHPQDVRLAALTGAVSDR
jgi:sugar/nucleoside kinase (ribokinase family)